MAASGLLAGFAVTSEYPLALVAAALGVYAIAKGDRIRRGVSYAAGAALGVLPLLLYSWWAFGSPLHLSYAGAVLRGGATGHDVLGANAPGFFGVSSPNRAVAVHLLFGYFGLVTLTPVVVAGAVGLLLLWRKGLRLEAALVSALSVGYIVYNSGYVIPFGGGTPGPRFLIPMLPFLALGFAPAYRSWPWATLALALPSGLIMLGVTTTDPIRATTWTWIDRVVDGSFSGEGVGPKLPFVVFALAGVALCAWVTPITRPGVKEAVGALLAFGAYLTVAFAGPRLVGTNPRLLLVVVAACLLVVAAWHRGLGARVRRQPQPTRDPTEALGQDDREVSSEAHQVRPLRSRETRPGSG